MLAWSWRAFARRAFNIIFVAFKRLWKILLGAGGIVLALALVPILTIETTCKAPIDGLKTTDYQPVIKERAWQRDEVRTWLSYPEWLVVNSDESFASFLARGNRPSGYHYLSDVQGYWSGFCAMNQAAGRTDIGERTPLYATGFRFSAEQLAKSLSENTLGRLSEAMGGWNSADDRYAAGVQQRFGAFTREHPWYEFPFGDALSGLWQIKEPRFRLRHWERRFSLSAAYGANAGYARLARWMSGARAGHDEQSLRLVVRGNGMAVAAADPRFKIIGPESNHMTQIEVPRSDQFTELLVKLAGTAAEPVEISGNDDIYLTLLMPSGDEVPGPSVHLLTSSVDDPPGWRRLGISTKVPDLLEVMRLTRQYGGRVEHVYDY